jgi:4-hydroxybenzoate polyprenyltransferase
MRPEGTATRRAGRTVGLIRACHPEPTLAVTAGATLLAVAVGRGAGGAVAVAVAVLASQLTVGWSNDWLDAARDSSVARSDKPISTGAISRRAVGIAAIIAGAGIVPLALLSGWPAATALIVGALGGLAYNWPLKFTVFSVAPYVVSFAALAGFVSLGRPGSPVPPWWLLSAGALLGGGAHFANVLPDLADDARTGVRGLPHRLGLAGSWAAAGSLLLLATALLAFGPAGSASWPAVATFGSAAVVLPIGWERSRTPGSRAAFRAVLVVAVLDVILLVANGARR